MTYAQHGGPTAPGPIAGLPWMKEMLDYAQSMTAKLELYNAYPGLRGVSIWVLGAEDPAVWNVMQGTFGR
jgi:spore germination protein YaaH